MKKSLRRKKTKKLKLRRSDILFFAVCIVVFVGFFCTVIAQERTLADIREEKAAGEKEIAALTQQLEVLSREEEYKKSEKFIEDMIRDEGYVREDEILFIEGN